MEKEVPDEVFRAYRSQLVYPSEYDLREDKASNAGQRPGGSDSRFWRAEGVGSQNRSGLIPPEHRQELVLGKGTAFGCGLKRIQNVLRQIRWQRFEPRDQIAEPRNPLK